MVVANPKPGIPARLTVRDEDLADKWIEKSNAWLEANRSQPFFLFFASHDIHVPRLPHSRLSDGAVQLSPGGWKAEAGGMHP